MRVLKVADHFPPQPGGLAIQVERIAQRLTDRGYEAAVITAEDRDEDEQRDGIEIRRRRSSFSRIPGVYQEGSPPFHPPWPDPAFRRELGAKVRAFRPDVIHVHGWSVFSAASLPGPRPPIVCTLHDYGLRCPKKSLMRHGGLCETGRGTRCLSCDSEAQPTPRRTALAGALGASVPWLSRRVARMMAVSGYVRDRYVQDRSLGDDQVMVLPPVIDPPPRVTGPGPLGERPYGLYVGPGEEQPHKGRHVLIDAFTRCRRNGHSLALVGGRNPVDAAGAPIVDLGYLRGEELGRAFSSASFMVVPSVWADPCPAVAVEALSLGIPVIASAVGGLTDIVDDGETGFLVPPGDAAALAGAMERLIADPELRARMGEKAVTGARRFATDVVIPRIEAVYAEVVGAGRPSGG